MNNITQTLNRLEARLQDAMPPGIEVSIAHGGSVTYRVRTMVAGKRACLGVFTEYAKALDALVSARYRGYTVQRIAELQAELQAELDAVEVAPDNKEALLAVLNTMAPHLIVIGLQFPERLLRSDAPEDAMVCVPDHIIREWWALAALEAKEEAKED